MKNESLSQTLNGRKYSKAIVMGACIAGQWTARALSDHFDNVLVLERDQLPDGQDYRSGAPQVCQFHTLLLSGLQQMKQWFPGLDQELIAAGAVPYDLTGDIQLRIRNTWCELQPAFTGIKHPAAAPESVHPLHGRGGGDWSAKRSREATRDLSADPQLARRIGLSGG